MSSMEVILILMLSFFSLQRVDSQLYGFPSRGDIHKLKDALDEATKAVNGQQRKSVEDVDSLLVAIAKAGEGVVNQTHKNATKCVEENLNEAKFTGKNAKQEINKIGEGAKADLNMKFIKCQMGFLPRDCYDTLPPVMANAAKKTVAKIVALIKDFDYQLVGILTGIRKC